MPFDRLAGALGRQHDREEFGIDLVAHAERAADVVRADAEFLRRKPDHAGQRVLACREMPCVGMQTLVGLVRRVVERGAGLRLHRIAGDALRVQRDAHDMRRVLEARLGAVAIAVLVVERQIVGPVVVDRRGARGKRGARGHVDRQVLVFDRDRARPRPARWHRSSRRSARPARRRSARGRSQARCGTARAATSRRRP